MSFRKKEKGEGGRKEKGKRRKTRGKKGGKRKGIMGSLNVFKLLQPEAKN